MSDQPDASASNVPLWDTSDPIRVRHEELAEFLDGAISDIQHPDQEEDYDVFQTTLDGREAEIKFQKMHQETAKRPPFFTRLRRAFRG